MKLTNKYLKTNKDVLIMFFLCQPYAIYVIFKIIYYYSKKIIKWINENIKIWLITKNVKSPFKKRKR